MNNCSDTAKEEDKSEDLKIEVDVNLVDKNITKNKEHKTGNMSFFLYDPKKQSTVDQADKAAKYVAKVVDKFSYVGILDENLKRQLLGLNTYPTKDIYFGEYKDNQRHGNGVYIYNTNEDEVEIFCGTFNEGKKDGKGIYLWNHSKDQDSPLNETCNFDASIGMFKDNYFLEGISISQSHNESNLVRSVYKGKCSNGKRNDENAMYLDYQSKILMNGKFENDDCLSGYLIKTSNDLKFTEQLFQYEKKDQENGHEIKTPNDEQEKVIKTANEFLNNLIESDYFNKLGGYFQDLLSEMKKFYEPDHWQQDLAGIKTKLEIRL